LKKITFFLIFIFTTALIFPQNIEKHYNFLIDSYKQIPAKSDDKDELAVLIEEIDRFLYNYPKFDKNYELYFIQGDLYKRIDEEDKAILAHFKNVRLYPKSEKKDESIKKLNELLDEYGKIKMFKDIIKKELIKDVKGDLEEKYYTYLKDLNGINYRGFSKLLIKDAYNFLLKFDKRKTDEIYIFIADSYFLNNDFKQALFNYRLVEKVYENSPLAPYAMLSRGNILENPLDKHQKALLVLKQMIDKYSKHPSVIQARFIRGDIYEKELKDYIRAIAEYRLIVEQFPDDSRCPKALMNISGIYRQKLDDPLRAVEYLKKLYENYHDDIQAPISVYLIAKIY